MKQLVLGLVAFLILMMIGVFIHEIGHLIVVLCYGGTIVDFGVNFTCSYISYYGIERDFLIGFSGAFLQGIFCMFFIMSSKNNLFLNFMLKVTIPALFLYALIEGVGLI